MNKGKCSHSALSLDSEERVDDIYYSLYRAKSGQEVYNALYQIPLSNLKDIKDMINHILKTRKGETE